MATAGPGGVPNQPAQPEKVGQLASKPVLEDDDYLYLFFPDTAASRTAGLASLRRLDYRLDRSRAEVTLEQVMAQTAAIRTYEGVWDRVPELERLVSRTELLRLLRMARTQPT